MAADQDPTWMSDWKMITDEWPLTDPRFAAIGRLFHAANQKGRDQEANGESPGPLPAPYEVPDL